MADSQITTEPEVFKPIPGFPGYEVSNLGKVRSYWRPWGSGKWKCQKTPQRVLRPSKANGYPQVNLWNNGERRRFLVHQLVLTVFVCPCPPGCESRHLDGIRSHIELSNLEWGTKIQNYNDRRSHGTDNLGKKNGRALLDESKVQQIRELRSQGIALKKLAEIFGVNFSTIHAIAKRRNWKHI
jgi:NUMOD4 motif/HNH endonuclease